MRKKTHFIACLLFLLLIPASGFGWGLATHTYFADKLGKSRGYRHLQELYGSMAPDMFNPLFALPYHDYLRLQTHIHFDKVMNRARTKNLKAFAFGFTSHNDAWGADFTAHHDGRTTPGIGYTIAQVVVLAPVFEDSFEQILLDNNVNPDQAKEIAAEYAPSVAHVAAELAVDILIKRNEAPGIGKKMLRAAQFRSPAIPALLVAAYAADFARESGLNYFAAAAIILGAEKAQKGYVSYYGYMFTKNEAKLIQLISAYSAELAELVLKAGKDIDISIPHETVANLLIQTIALVESSYAAEIAATLAYLRNEMPLHENDPKSHPPAIYAQAGFDSDDAMMVDQFSLAQNQPNPFNPVTAINYSLAKDSPVKITVYNILGQQIAVLVDQLQAKGFHQVIWNAHNQPSGLYIYRLEADGFTVSRKMFLEK